MVAATVLHGGGHGAPWTVRDAIATIAGPPQSVGRMAPLSSLLLPLSSLLLPLCSLLLPASCSEFRPSLRLEELNSSSLMQPVESLEARLTRVARVQQLLYDTEEFVYPDYPDPPGLPPPTAPSVRDVRIVVKSLPGAGPRIPGERGVAGATVAGATVAVMAVIAVVAVMTMMAVMTAPSQGLALSHPSGEPPITDSGFQSG